MKKILLLLLSLCSIFVTAQEEASNWYFGENAGISFSPVDGSITNLNNGQLDTKEGCSSISDNNGNLLFYTDGTTVYNKNHTVMNNGNNLLGDESSTQSAIVVPKPEDPNIYYIFTVGSNQNPTGLKYSVVDMTLAGGLGAVIQKNVSLLNQCSEKISAVLKDCASGEIWVVTLANQNGGTGFWNTFYAYSVSQAGINTTPVKSVLNLPISDSRGYLKLSPDGTKLACANGQSGLYLFDFDSQTGIVSNTRQLNINNNANVPYGIEFSPDSSLLYVTASNDFFSGGGADENPTNHRSVLVQFNLASFNINNSQVTIDDRQLYRGGIQLAPDGKIYRALSITYGQGAGFLGVIKNPNVLGLGCEYQHNAVSLGSNKSTQGLPPFIQSFFNQKIDIINNSNNTNSNNYLPLCTGEAYTLSIEPIPGAIYTWSMDGNILLEADHDLTVTQEGFYELYVELSGGDCETLEGEATVVYLDYPIANTQADVVICDDNNDGSWTFNLTQFDAAILGTQDPNDFTVKYYSTLEHAENDTNELFVNYPNTSNPQQIFARVSNNGNTNCYDITSFQIEVFNTPSAPAIGDLIVCDDGSDGDATNGQTAIQLSDFDADVYNGQDTTAYTITYHSSQADADAGTGDLPTNYYNQTPFNETIFARIENNLSSDCYSTTSINLEINPIPDAFDASLVQCDEDGIPDGQTLFNFDEIVDTITGGAADRLVTFYASQNDANNNQNALDGTAYSNLSNPQTIYVTVTNSLTGCSDMAELTLEVSMTQINDYIAPAVCDEIDSEDGINPFDLDAIANDMLLGLPANLDLNFYETYEDALLEQNTLVSPYTNTTPYSQILFARAENNNACYGISEVTLTVNPLPQLLEDETSYYCLNTFPEFTTLEGGVINDLPNNYYYEWSTGATTSFIQINQAGTYTVTVTNTLGCSKTRTITVEDSNIATFETIEVIDGSASFNNIVNVLVSGEGTYQYALANSDGIYLPYQDSPIFENVFPGIYTVLVRDVKNDCGIVEDLVSVIGFPKFFTPNNDGSHDTWQVYGIAGQFQPNSKILIFDRYGKLLKELDPLGRGWDGTLNGEPLPTSDYWFAVTLQDGRLFKSHFTLKR